MPQSINFRRHWWMSSAHIETIAAAFSKSPVVEYEREIVKTRENDEFALDYIIGREDMPLVVIFHGLEGCSQSHCVRLMASGFAAAGWTVAAPNFRSCGGHMNRLPRAYHAADINEIGWMLKYCRELFTPTKNPTMYAIGVSLGGTALLQYLAQTPAAEMVPLSAAAGLSVPFDLTACVQQLDSGIRRQIYARHFLKMLRAKVLEKSHYYPSICDLRKLKKITTIGAFDELYTARVHGFADAATYWRTASITAKTLRQISLPLLCINATNDPLIPERTLPQTAKPPVFFRRPQQGGHGGFFGNPPDWLYNEVNQFFIRRGGK